MFEIKEPNVNIGNEISIQSFEIVQNEAKQYDRYNTFDDEQKDIVTRLIHTTTCFTQVIDNIYFSQNSINKIKSLLENKAKIIVDTNMIKSGLSEFYLSKYQNDVICYVNEPKVYKMAEEENTTRSYSAVKIAILENKNQPMILACGNAPTFIYSAIKTLIEEKVDLSLVAFLIFPVGFVNVVESKEYAKEFMEYFGVEGIMLDGRYGASTMIVATLHSIYKLIKDYDGKEKYNGK